MFAYITYKKGSREKTIKKIKKLKLFSKIKPLKKNQLKLETSKPVFTTNTREIEYVQEQLKIIDSITISKLYTILKPSKKEDEFGKPPKLLNLFFDIDSTLTHTGLGTLNRNVKSIFQKFLFVRQDYLFLSGENDFLDFSSFPDIPPCPQKR